MTRKTHFSIILTINAVFFIVISCTEALVCFTDPAGNKTSSCQMNSLSYSSPIQVDDHCSIQQNFSSSDAQFYCNNEEDDCKPNIVGNIFFCEEGHLISVYCCNTNFCNDHSKLIKTVSNNSIKLCFNSTTYSKYGATGNLSSFSGETIKYEFALEEGTICLHDTALHFFEGNCLNISMPDDTFVTKCIVPIENCINDNCTENPNRTATPSTNQHSHPSPKNKFDSKNGISVGFVIGAILVLVSGLVLVGVGAKKCYEKHVNNRSEYNYAQLTIDMAGEDDDDERLILP